MKRKITKKMPSFLIEFERETDKRWIAEIPRLPTREENASFWARGRLRRPPNRKVFWAKKAVGDSAFWEKKIFNHAVEN